jgi:hypothetical protein
MWPAAAHVRAMWEDTIPTCGRLRAEVWDTEQLLQWGNTPTSQQTDCARYQPSGRLWQSSSAFSASLGTAWAVHVHKLMNNSLYALTSHPSSPPSRGSIGDGLHTKLVSDAKTPNQGVRCVGAHKPQGAEGWMPSQRIHLHLRFMLPITCTVTKWSLHTCIDYWGLDHITVKDTSSCP